jgi:hypothetical protein
MSSANASIPVPGSGGYSASVSLELRVNGHVLSIAKLGSDSLVFADEVTVSPGPAEVVMHVDGRERRWQVCLHPAQQQPARVVPMSIVA